MATQANPCTSAVANIAPFHRALGVPAFALFLFAPALPAQQPMATLASHEALISGGLSVHNDNTTLLSNASITAFDHTAALALDRGGNLFVCSTSQVHLLHSGPEQGLLFSLDRGALQLATPTHPQDILLTPDLRFTIAAPGTLDLRLRVTREGDTCVENRGLAAPTLLLTDAFGDATYRVLPDQHVLFVHGSLREVVDHERAPCGCPQAPPAQLAANATEAERAAAAHPFPEADSQGLTSAPVHPPELSTAGGVRSSTDFHINAGDTSAIALTTTAPTAVPAPAAATVPPPSPPGPKALAHKLGRFFHRLFHHRKP